MFPKLDIPVVLSPMAGVTDVAFRALCRQYGAGMTTTEFVSSAAIVRGNNKSLDLTKTDPSESPVAVQLFGSSVEEVVAAARAVQDRFDVVDVNCGCPAWKVIKGGSGSALLSNPEKIGRFVEQLVDQCNKPITVKIRLGIDDAHINAVDVAKVVQDAGASAIAIHGRTQKQAYRGVANWDEIVNVKQAVSIPVIGNGDVFSPEICKQRLDMGVDAVMIARGAIGRPFIFAQIKEFLSTGAYQEYDPRICFLEYLPLAEQYDISFGAIKTHALSFTKGLQGGAALRRELAKAKDVETLRTLMT